MGHQKWSRIGLVHILAISNNPKRHSKRRPQTISYFLSIFNFSTEKMRKKKLCSKIEFPGSSHSKHQNVAFCETQKGLAIFKQTVRFKTLKPFLFHFACLKMDCCFELGFNCIRNSKPNITKPIINPIKNQSPTQKR